MQNQKPKSKSISIIGLRAFPAEFVGTSGLEVYAENVIFGLHKLRPDLRLLVYTKKIYQKSMRVPDKITVIPLFTIRAKVLESVIYSFVASIKSMFNKSEFVWYHGAGPAIFSLLPKLAGKKIAITVHSLDWERKKWSRVEKLFFRLSFQIITYTNPLVFAVSPNIEDELKLRFNLSSWFVPPGIVPSKKTVPVGVLKSFALQPNQYILYVGRFVPEKRIEWLIKVFKSIKKTYPTLKLVLAGGHGNAKKYENNLRLLGSDEMIVWPGYVFGQIKATLFAYAKSFVLPSELEGNSIALLEAVSYDCKCVAAKQIIPDILRDSKQIFPFESNYYSSFVKAVQQSLKFGKNSSRQIFRSKNQDYNWRSTCKKYLQAFSKS